MSTTEEMVGKWIIIKQKIYSEISHIDEDADTSVIANAIGNLHDFFINAQFAGELDDVMSLYKKTPGTNYDTFDEMLINIIAFGGTKADCFQSIKDYFKDEGCLPNWKVSCTSIQGMQITVSYAQATQMQFDLEDNFDININPFCDSYTSECIKEGNGLIIEKTRIKMISSARTEASLSNHRDLFGYTRSLSAVETSSTKKYSENRNVYRKSATL
ncbi:MAG: hypothetical protein HOI53_02810 [Francisellaceae bacterium]|jgi:hypothetical protein|nr:hypothetical protein [Francisellaceae bacterium]MBT6206935.1 hypothetical protein [Francisellaceae bacterium]MBT6538488.1 hypothetical protein [Francisellaceae bacterium]